MITGSWRRVLVPLDGSAFSSWAIRRACALLQRPAVTVTLLQVVEAPERMASELAFRLDPRHREACGRLEVLRDALRARSIRAEAEMRFGDPASEILRETVEGLHDVVVMATHGRTGLPRLLMGSVAQRVIRASPVPVLLLRPRQTPEGSLSPVESQMAAAFSRMLLPLDGEETGLDILPAARALAGLMGTKLHLLTVVPAPSDREKARLRLSRLSWTLEAEGHAVETCVRVGKPVPESLAAIRERGLDAAALMTRGPEGLDRAWSGSFFDQLLERSGVPLLSLRHASLREPPPLPTGSFRLVRV
jgi:nucleotide-binding universal stress UspA family protein